MPVRKFSIPQPGLGKMKEMLCIPFTREEKDASDQDEKIKVVPKDEPQISEKQPVLTEEKSIKEKQSAAASSEDKDEGEETKDFADGDAKKTDQQPDPALAAEEKRKMQEAQFAAITRGEEEEATSDGEECELHMYERRYDNGKGEVYVKAGTKTEFKRPKRRSHKASLVLVRKYGHSGRYKYTQLEIQSRWIIKALQEIIGKYEGVNFNTKVVTITEPPRCLFHYRNELQQYAESSDDRKMKAHMQLCLQYVEKTLEEEMKVFAAFKSDMSRTPSLEHRHLWMVFKPGCLVYEKIDGVERLSRLHSISRTEREDEAENAWNISTDIVKYCGSKIGFLRQSETIEVYGGSRPVCELSAVPLDLHPEATRIRRDLLERGQKFLSFHTFNYCTFDGVGQMCDLLTPKESETQYTNMKHRIIIDTEHYSRNVDGTYKEFVSGQPSFNFDSDAILHFSDEDIMTCYHCLPGFSLESKRWGLFPLESITDVTYNDRAFEALVLPEEKKDLISSLLARRGQTDAGGFDDLIQGKGKGLTFLLHGPPGVGKTFTAESIADHTYRPLLKISSAELLGPGATVEQRLSHFFLLATRWGGVMLLDEADVFMQERTNDSLDRNQLVSTLLRVLEYYEGILFLTTNRVETIDYAFKSRIHLSIAYPPLSIDARQALWKASLTRANDNNNNHSEEKTPTPPQWLTTEFFRELAEKKLNGREIKNVTRLAHSLAWNKKRGIMPEDVWQALKAWREFETDSAAAA